MKTEDIPTKQPGLWIPERNIVFLAILGKLGEEANELGGSCARATIQGLDGLDPESGQPNRLKIAEEIADVGAMSALAGEYFVLDPIAMELRVRRKVAFKRPWLEGLAALSERGGV